MALRIGEVVPDCRWETAEGTINSLHEWIGDGWVDLFSLPKDFTPVCTTELGYMAKLKPEFEKRGVKVLGLSVDPVDSHKKWAKDIEETQGAALNFPVIADSEQKVARLYDMIHPELRDVFTVRPGYFIGPDQQVKAMMTYP